VLFHGWHNPLNQKGKTVRQYVWIGLQIGYYRTRSQILCQE
jgi:hypothetical protein